MKEKSTINTVTINTRLRGVRALVNYCIELGYIDSFKISLLKNEKEIKQTYTDDEIKLLLRKPDLKKCLFAEYRNWVVINYLLATRKPYINNMQFKKR